MRIHIENFKDVLKKATLNSSIDSVQLILTDDKITSKMISRDRSNIVILNIENEAVKDFVDEEIEFNFNEPAQSLIPFLNLIDEEEADLELNNEKIVIKNGRQKSNIHFCSPTVVSVFTSDARNVGYFLEMPISDEFIEAYNKIKKIGARFGKIYFSAEGGKFTFETSDKTNRYSNGLKFDIAEIDDNKKLTICFDFKNFVNLMTVISESEEEFKLCFAYAEEQEMGMLFCGKNDESEKYYLMSREI